jgi:hypothetical protein
VSAERHASTVPREVLVPLDYPPGDLGEVDFFEAFLFVVRLMCSGRDFRAGYFAHPRESGGSAHWLSQPGDARNPG